MSTPHATNLSQLWQESKGLAITKAMALLKKYGMSEKVPIQVVIIDIEVAFMKLESDDLVALSAELHYGMAKLAGQSVNKHRKSAQQRFEGSLSGALPLTDDSRASVASRPYVAVYEEAARRDECEQLVTTANGLSPDDRVVFAVDQWSRNDGIVPDFMQRLDLRDHQTTYVRLCQIVSRLHGARLARWNSIARQVRTTIRDMINQRRATMARSVARILPALTSLLALVFSAAEVVAKVH